MNAHARLSPGKYRLTVDDFLLLDATGVFGSDRIELLDGDIIVMNAEYRPHARIAGEVGYRLRLALAALASDLEAMTASVALSGHDMPLPDVALTSEPHGEGPIPVSSVALVVEVSSTTLDRDMGDKQRLYARADIPEYWVVDVNGRVIHQMWAPTPGGYDQRRYVPFGERIEAATLASLGVETTTL